MAFIKKKKSDSFLHAKKNKKKNSKVNRQTKKQKIF